LGSHQLLSTQTSNKIFKFNKLKRWSCWWTLVMTSPASQLVFLFELCLIAQYLIKIRINRYKTSIWTLLDSRKNLEKLATKKISGMHLTSEEFKKKYNQLMFQVTIFKFLVSKISSIAIVAIFFCGSDFLV
jgi:hypothetical protein